MQPPCRFKANSSETVKKRKRRVRVTHMPMSKASTQIVFNDPVQNMNYHCTERSFLEKWK